MVYMVPVGRGGGGGTSAEVVQRMLMADKLGSASTTRSTSLGPDARATTPPSVRRWGRATRFSRLNTLLGVASL